MIFKARRKFADQLGANNLKCRQIWTIRLKQGGYPMDRLKTELTGVNNPRLMKFLTLPLFVFKSRQLAAKF